MSYTIKPITAEDNNAVYQLITKVGLEYGAIGEGYGPSDAEVSSMSKYYISETKGLYLVAKINDEVIGGCGIASFNGSAKVCELKKLYILAEHRGLGVGNELSLQCLNFAKTQGFTSCYLDTLSSMSPAIKLYERLGFYHLNKALKGAEHSGCDIWMLKAL